MCTKKKKKSRMSVVKLILMGFRAPARREPISGGSNHHPLCSHGSCASIDGGGIENGPPLHLPSPFEGRKKKLFCYHCAHFRRPKIGKFFGRFFIFCCLWCQNRSEVVFEVGREKCLLRARFGVPLGPLGSASRAGAHQG